MKKIESEKLLERKLSTLVKNMGGWCLKLPSTFITGLPDRLCLLPNGVAFFVEVKTTRMKPRKIQLIIHNKLRKMGFVVEIVDTTEKIKKVLKSYE